MVPLTGHFFQHTFHSPFFSEIEYLNLVFNKVPLKLPTFPIVSRSALYIVNMDDLKGVVGLPSEWILDKI